MNTLIRVGGVPEHFNLPWKLAIAGDAFAQSGVVVRYSDYPAGTGEMTRALRESDLDVALVLTEGAIADIIRNDVNRLVKVYVDSPLIWGIHVAVNGEIKDLGSIQGRRIAISRYGSGSHLIAIVDAAERGWQTEEMSFVIVDDLNGARRALAAGAADVFLWERHMTQPLVNSGEFRRVGEREVPWPAIVVSVRRDILESSGQQIRAVLDIVFRYASNLKRRKSAAALVSETYGIRTLDAANWLASVRWCGGYRRPVRAIERVANALENQRVVEPGRFDIDRVWHRI